MSKLALPAWAIDDPGEGFAGDWALAPIVITDDGRMAIAAAGFGEAVHRNGPHHRYAHSYTVPRWAALLWLMFHEGIDGQCFPVATPRWAMCAELLMGDVGLRRAALAVMLTTDDPKGASRWVLRTVSDML
jgi:hypothetical protein